MHWNQNMHGLGTTICMGWELKCVLVWDKSIGNEAGKVIMKTHD